MYNIRTLIHGLSTLIARLLGTAFASYPYVWDSAGFRHKQKQLKLRAVQSAGGLKIRI